MNKFNLDVSKLDKKDWLYNNCKEYSLYILANYSKTEKELIDKLKKTNKYTDDIINKTLLFLKKYKFIDDENYVKRFFEKNKNNYSIKVIKTKLLIKGVKKDTIEQIVSEQKLVDNFDTIKKLLLKKYPNYYIETYDIKQKQKIFSYLYRKGFNYEDINKVLNIDNFD